MNIKCRPIRTKEDNIKIAYFINERYSISREPLNHDFSYITTIGKVYVGQYKNDKTGFSSDD